MEILKHQTIGIFNMDHNSFEKLSGGELWTFITVLITGAVGGCAAAFTGARKEKRVLTFLSILGYGFAGLFGSITYFCMLFILNGNTETDLHSFILFSLMAGFVTSTSLAGTNLVLKLVLKKIGIEIDVEIKRTKNKNEGSS